MSELQFVQRRHQEGGLRRNRSSSRSACLVLRPGGKIFLVGIIGKILAVISLSVTQGLLLGGVLLSLWKTRGQVAPVDLQG